MRCPAACYRSLWICVLVLVICHVLPGCSRGPAWLTFKSTQSDKQYTQKFNKAYFSRSDGGEYNAVLVEDGLLNTAPKPTGPIVSSGAAPLSQVVNLRVLWRPLRGSNPDTPSATNAVIDWYVRSNDPAARDDQLHYRGAGFVTIYDSDKKARFDIRNAHLELAEGTGRLQDPLGAASLSGSFDAVRNEGMVASTVSVFKPRSVLSQVPQPQASAHDGPPPRAPTEP